MCWTKNNGKCFTGWLCHGQGMLGILGVILCYESSTLNCQSKFCMRINQVTKLLVLENSYSNEASRFERGIDPNCPCSDPNIGDGDQSIFQFKRVSNMRWITIKNIPIYIYMYYILYIYIHQYVPFLFYIILITLINCIFWLTWHMWFLYNLNRHDITMFA